MESPIRVKQFNSPRKSLRRKSSNFENKFSFKRRSISIEDTNLRLFTNDSNKLLNSYNNEKVNEKVDFSKINVYEEVKILNNEKNLIKNFISGYIDRKNPNLKFQSSKLSRLNVNNSKFNNSNNLEIGEEDESLVRILSPKLNNKKRNLKLSPLLTKKLLNNETLTAKNKKYTNDIFIFNHNSKLKESKNTIINLKLLEQNDELLASNKFKVNPKNSNLSLKDNIINNNSNFPEHQSFTYANNANNNNNNKDKETSSNRTDYHAVTIEK